MLADPLVLLLIFRLELFFSELGVVDALIGPLRVIALEVAPNTVGLLELATGRAFLPLVILLCSSLHDQLEGK